MVQGTLFIVSAPSGAGKTSLVNALCERLPSIAVSVSHTTRQRREGEADGRDYHFVSHDVFQRLIEEQDFLEYAKVFDNFYGTSKSALQQLLETGKDVILEIDWQGARQVREIMPGTRSVFVLPPSLEVLDQRLRGRGQDSDDIIARRMRDARQEMMHHDEYEYLIVNDDFDHALTDLVAVFRANRLRLGSQKILHRELISRLISG